MTNPTTPEGIQIATDIPRGYRVMGAIVRASEKAFLFEYHHDQLWIPKKAVRHFNGTNYAPMFHVMRAQNFNLVRGEYGSKQRG